MQSRYYNPETGRFLNADAFTATDHGPLGNNMFAYCSNNPVNHVDPDGHIMRMRKDVASVGGGSGSLLIAALVTFGAALKSAAEYTGKQLSKAYTAISTRVEASKTAIKEKARAQAIAIAKSSNENYQYWEATRVSGAVVTGRGLTFSEASLHVAAGMDIMCANQGAALWLLVVNCYWGAVGPEIHGDEGYYWHYHPNRNSHTHIWYMSGG